MPNTNIFSTMKTPIRLKLFGQVTDPGGHGDFSTAQVRSLALDDGVLLALTPPLPWIRTFGTVGRNGTRAAPCCFTTSSFQPRGGPSHDLPNDFTLGS
jgi:hypothetical protein